MLAHKQQTPVRESETLMIESDAGPAAQEPRRLFWGALLLLLAVTAVVFYGVLGHQFLIYDDNSYVLQNPLIHPLDPAGVVRMFTRTYFRSYTPLTHLSHALDFAFWGPDPFGHHLTNYFLHLVNAGLLFFIGCSLFLLWKEPGGEGYPDPWHRLFAKLTPSAIVGALVGAGFFALHPLRTESVAWISDRKDLLMTTFLLTSLGAYLLSHLGSGTAAGRRLYIVSFLSAILAMLAKSVASMLPLVLLMIDAAVFRVPRERKAWKQALIEKVPFLLGSFSVGVFSVIAVTGILRHPKVYEPSVLEEILLPAYTWSFYLLKNIWPVGLSPIYSFPSKMELVFSAVLVLALTGAAVILYLRRQERFWLLAWGFYMVFLVPTILGRESAGIQAWADRYSYLPSVAPGLLLGGLVCWLWSLGGSGLRIVVGALSAVLMGVLSLFTMRQVPVWHDTESVFRHAAAASPSALMAHANLGMVLAAAGKTDEALVALEKAMALNDHYAQTYEVLALAYDKKGETEKAIGLYRKAISLDSNFIDAYSNLGNTLMVTGRYDEAIHEYLEAIRKDPEFFDAYYNMGIAYYRRGDPSAAMEVFRRAMGVNPINSDTYLNIGIIYSDWGDEAAAFAQYQKAAALGNVQAKRLVHLRSGNR
jgi:Tfp pilus assembly protein PilF